LSAFLDKKIPLCKPSINSDDLKVVSDAIKSGWLAHGSCNHDFEDNFARYIGVKHAITMNSCTSALEIALKAHGIKGEVIIPSFTWVATANAVINAGATPVFADVDYETRNLLSQHIESRINHKTEAIIVVHFGGQICLMADILKLCEKHHLLLVEDSAETIGARFDHRQAGSFGVGCFSFFPTKNITTGEGGMLTTNDQRFAAKCRALISHGISTTTFARENQNNPWERAADYAGHNYRMPNPLAALGNNQLARLEKFNSRRQDIAHFYNSKLKTLDGLVKTPKIAQGAEHVYQTYTITVEKRTRNDLVKFLNHCNVGASVHFDPPVHLQPFYKNFLEKRCVLPSTEKLSAEVISLPIYPDMTLKDQRLVVKRVKEYFTR
jgi:perosamine synthetase